MILSYHPDIFIFREARDHSKPWNFAISELVTVLRHCDYATLDCALGLPNIAKECLHILRQDPQAIADFRFTLYPEDLRNIYSCKGDTGMSPFIAVQMLAYFLYQLPEVDYS
jgi:hypothetical protein